MIINWRVRMRNPVFWMTLIPAVAAVVYTLMDACGAAPAFPREEAVRYAGVVVTGLTALGVLVDPTTAGVGDSDRAMQYDTPYREEE